MKFLLSLILSLMILSSNFAQEVIKGKVIDASLGSAISYVNIGIPARAKGTVSDDLGNYELALIEKTDTIIISAIGYESKAITAARLLENSEVKLVQMIHDIPLVEVVASKIGQDLLLGRKLKKRYRSISFASDQLGTELAARIKVKQKTYLKSAHFIINNVKKDDVLFRVNIYDFKDKKVGKNLLRENLIAFAPPTKGTLEVDLSSFNLIVENDVLLSLELIKGDGKAIAFNSKKVFSGKHCYMKNSSNTEFFRLNKLHFMLPKLQLGFYMKGKEILE